MVGRLVCVVVVTSICAVLWAIVPLVQESGTEMAFTPGSPDPNVYQTTYSFGPPLVWLRWERSWNDAAGYDESRVAMFNVWNFGAHVLVFVTPVLLGLWAYRKRPRSRAALVANP